MEPSPLNTTSTILLIVFAFLLALFAALLCLRIIRDPERFLRKTGKEATQHDAEDQDRLLLRAKRRGKIGLGLIGVCLVVLGLASVGLHRARQQFAEFERNREELLQSLRVQTAHVKKHQATSELEPGIKLLEEVVESGESTGTVDQEKLNEAMEQLDDAIGKLNDVAEIYEEALEEREKFGAKD
ncbi:MAG: hypothetical protein AAGH89_04000 [Verrucomicrobiota bacterium]